MTLARLNDDNGDEHEADDDASSKDESEDETPDGKSLAVKILAQRDLDKPCLSLAVVLTPFCLEVFLLN